MAEALAAVAIAGNVLQFLEAGGRFALRAVRHITADLEGLLENLQQSEGDTRDPLLQQLLSLSTGCSSVIQELLNKLSKIGLGNSHKRMDLMVEEFKATWHRRDIQELENRISRFREQLAAHLVAVLRDLAMKTLAQQDTILSEIRALRDGAERADECAPGKGRHSTKAIGDIIIGSLAESLHSEDDEKSQVDLLRAAMQKKLVAMHNRNWIFRDDSDPSRKTAHFSQWMKSDLDSNLFWITGKAGSGKSMLVKYVSDFKSKGGGATTCRGYLTKWAGASTLITASFYFWASGAAIEGSQKAMFSSLLFQLLQETPEVIPRIAPAILWESACLFNTPFGDHWTEDSLGQLLLDAVRELLGEARRRAKTGWTSLAVIRVRLYPLLRSSWWYPTSSYVFQVDPGLSLGTLTAADRACGTLWCHTLTKNEGFMRLKKREPAYADTLMHQITDKSSAVFLWVSIVVKLMLSGLSNDDRIRDLENRLNSLPPHLEQLYEKILRDLDPFYFEHVCQYFKLMLDNESSAKTILLSFADEEDHNFGIRQPVRPLSSRRRATRIETLRRRLNSRCKGLLEIGVNDRVNFLHRAVRDFLVRPDVSSKIDGALTGTRFDTHFQLCSAYFAVLKTEPTEETTSYRARESLDDRRHKWIEGCLEGASKSRPDLVPPKLYGTYPDGPLTFFKSSSFVLSGDGFLALTTRFGVADYLRARVSNGAQSDLKNIIKGKRADDSKLRRLTGTLLRQKPKTAAERAYRRPLLVDACFCFPPKVEVFRCLLDHGADYNQTVFTPDCFLGNRARSFSEAITFELEGISLLAVVVAAAIITSMSHRDQDRQRETWDSWTRVLELFAKRGARLRRTIADDVACNLTVESDDWVAFKSAEIHALLDSVSKRDFDGLNWSTLRSKLYPDDVVLQEPENILPAQMLQ
ncbi:hypothetical protein B0H66DRAFT_530023 [Apodospora peruviana]|uniref:NACHT domain-containing protein n=1 Tax=Apodospora peruviana TaxID=516989 RepID=A0AAE0IJ13_9PEZI|nr:hypothetical protein B0H66DRAFT_530023 [Apodospora peruviana]